MTSILFEETFFQKNKQGQSLKKILENANCFPGIKIDQGLEKINNRLAKILAI